MSSTNDGDYIGTESCINDVNHDDFDDMNDPGTPVINKRTCSTKKKEKKEFPPPIPLLARTQNLSSHMPWELKRYYTTDGRLILKEEKVRHHHYFRAHRANGRLTLQLVPLDHMLHINSLSLSEEVEEEEAACPPQTVYDDDDETDNDTNVENSQADDRCRDEVVGNGLPRPAPAGASNCNLKFNRVSSAPSCLFEMPLHPIRTVQG